MTRSKSVLFFYFSKAIKDYDLFKYKVFGCNKRDVITEHAAERNFRLVSLVAFIRVGSQSLFS